MVGSGGVEVALNFLFDIMLKIEQVLYQHDMESGTASPFMIQHWCSALDTEWFLFCFGHLELSLET